MGRLAESCPVQLSRRPYPVLWCGGLLALSRSKGGADDFAGGRRALVVVE